MRARMRGTPEGTLDSPLHTEMETEEERAALQAAASGDANWVGRILRGYTPRLRQMLQLRIAPQLAGRVGVSDVLQEAFVEVTRRLPQYLAEREHSGERAAMPFFLWVRYLAGQELVRAYRFHVGARRRDAGRDRGLHAGAFPEASSACLAIALADSGISPSRAASEREAHEILAEALEALTPEEREILMMRHFEHLTNREIAHLLQMSEPGASLRHLRALKRLRGVLAQKGLEFPG